MHIFTVPIIAGVKPTTKRAILAKESIQHRFEPEYHGNPVSDKGSLVTYHWGYDIVSTIYKSSGMPTIVLQIDDIEKGIRAEYIDVLVSIKN